MRAIILKHDGYSGLAQGPAIDDAGEYLELADIERPSAGPGQVVIRLRASCVNPSDLHYIKGEYGQPRIKGAAAGFEGCGDVVEGVSALVGKRVAFVVGKGGSGAWAEYALTDAQNVIPLQDGISDEDGAAQIVNPLTAMAMVDMARQAGDALVISAASSQLGKLMIPIAAEAGLKTVALVRRDDARAPLEALGASEVLNTTSPDFERRIAQVCTALGPRMFLDAVSDQTSETVFCAMPRGTRWVVYGNLGTTPPKLTQIGQLIFMGKQIEGFWLTGWLRNTAPEVLARVVAQAQERFVTGRWKTDIAARLPLEKVVSGLAAASKLTDGKVLITPDSVSA